MNLSIVIPTRNKWPRLEQTLLSLRNVKEEFEVVVVDDASDEETGRKIADYKAPFPLVKIRNPRAGGRSFSRNIGAKHSRGERILFLDDDCLVSPGIVRGHSALLPDEVGHGQIFNMPYLKFFANPVTGELFPDVAGDRDYPGLRRMCLDPNDILTNFEKIARANQKINALERLALEVLKIPQCKLAWVACSGTNLSVSRSLWERVRFDERFGLEWGAEDLEFGLRLQRAGAKMVLVDNAQVYHMDHVRAFFAEKVTASFRTFMDIHPDVPEIRVVCDYLLGKCDIEEVLELCECRG